MAALIDLGPLVGLRARPARPEGKVVMLQRARGDVGLYVSEVAGIEEIPDRGDRDERAFRRGARAGGFR